MHLTIRGVTVRSRFVWMDFGICRLGSVSGGGAVQFRFYCSLISKGFRCDCIVFFSADIFFEMLKTFF